MPGIIEEDEVALRPEYSLGHSRFNALFFAYVDDECTDLPLTVLSALARLGFDPWKKAARLSEMSEETATPALAATIAGYPEGNWTASEARSIAVRLIISLPELSLTGERCMTSTPYDNASTGSRTQASTEMDKYGITRVAVDHFHLGQYRYTNLEDAIAEAKRQQGKG